MSEHEEGVAVIDLGAASEVTRGQALYNEDIGGGRRDYVAGIADD